MDKKPVLKVTAFGTHILTGNYVHPHTDQCRLIRRYTGPCTLEIKLGCVVRMVVDSILPHAECGPNDHSKDAPPFINNLILDGVQFRWYLQDLGHQWTDLDETLGVYRVHPDIMQRHIFDFRFRPQTGSGLFLETGSSYH